ncbi:hypothetical protein, partial [Caballeronia sp.]|uniref:hypothetical protein n=1 Tax=Caballeronia sp. TaxID=1931223 RepID=UPI003C66B17E
TPRATGLPSVDYFSFDLRIGLRLFISIIVRPGRLGLQAASKPLLQSLLQRLLQSFTTRTLHCSNYLVETGFYRIQ